MVPGPGNSKNHECIIIFLEFWRSAAEAAACKFYNSIDCGSKMVPDDSHRAFFPKKKRIYIYIHIST
jgi:hypothetical protein